MYSNGHTLALGAKHSSFLFQDAPTSQNRLLVLERMLTLTVTLSEGEMGFALFFPPQFCETFK